MIQNGSDVRDLFRVSSGMHRNDRQHLVAVHRPGDQRMIGDPAPGVAPNPFQCLLLLRARHAGLKRSTGKTLHRPVPWYDLYLVRNLVSRILRFSFAALLLGLALLAAGVANNNLSLRRLSRSEFQRRLDRSILNGTDWEASLPDETNAYLVYMLRDCVEMSGEPRLAALLRRSAPGLANTYLARLVDPNAPFVAPSSDLNTASAYERWIVHAISRGQYALSTGEKTEMFQLGSARTGKATHKLFSLVLYRRYNGPTPALDRLIRHLSVRIAREAALDFRVTDLYLQRIAFLLAAGQSDLVRPRWVERALAAQDPSGGWLFNWYGWSPTPYKFGFDDLPSSHATSQGLWLSYLLKHRYPDWIQRHYPS